MISKKENITGRNIKECDSKRGMVMSFFDFNRDGEVDLAEHFLAYKTFFTDETDDEQNEIDAEYGTDMSEDEVFDDDW